MKQNHRGYIVLLMLVCLTGSIAVSAVDMPPPPNLISRAAWGAKPPVKPYKAHVIERITIHHQGVKAGTTQDAKQRLRNMQAFHQSEKRGFADISYHFIIDRNGNLYEGRPLTAPGESKTDYNPEGHLSICLLGNFNMQDPTEKQIETLRALVQWGLQTFHLTTDTVKAHRDYARTDCPGKNLYRRIQEGTLLKMN